MILPIAKACPMSVMSWQYTAQAKRCHVVARPGDGWKTD